MNSQQAIRTLLGAAAAVAMLYGSVCAESAKEIVRKSDENYRGASSYAEITMTIVKPDWSREMSLKMWSKGDDYGVVLVTAPSRDKGTVTLKRENEVWNWVPSIERVIKIPPSMMMQSWLGSDFTNDDLVKQSSIVKDYTHTLLGDTVIDGHACHIIAMVPKEHAPVVWGRILAYVTKEHYIQLRSEMFDEDGYLSKIMTSSDIRTFGKRRLPVHWEMQPAEKPDQRTVLDYREWQFDMPMDDAFFSQQNMRRVR
jgi:outer membrane lipoprotein-sorting protein